MLQLAFYDYYLCLRGAQMQLKRESISVHIENIDKDFSMSNHTYSQDKQETQ